MLELDHKEGWVPKNWWFWTVVLEKTLASPLDSKEIKPVNPKGNQPWIFIGRTDAEAPILWPPDAKSWLLGKYRDVGKEWRQEKGMTEDEMAGWHHSLDGCESEWTLGVGDGQGGLACCDSWGCKESDTTERLNWTEQQYSYCSCVLSFIFFGSAWCLALVYLWVLNCLWAIFLVTQLFLTLCNPTDSARLLCPQIILARILEWVALSSSRGSSWPKDQTRISCIGRRILHHWATREAPIRMQWFLNIL